MRECGRLPSPCTPDADQPSHRTGLSGYGQRGTREGASRIEGSQYLESMRALPKKPVDETGRLDPLDRMLASSGLGLHRIESPRQRDQERDRDRDRGQDLFTDARTTRVENASTPYSLSSETWKNYSPRDCYDSLHYRDLPVSSSISIESCEASPKPPSSLIGTLM